MDKEQKRLSKLEFLKAKKARDGKLNKLGEWLLSIECKTIAQAIVVHAPIISSDHKFKMYESYGLDFVFNKR